jgi:hypothetical protein
MDYRDRKELANELSGWMAQIKSKAAESGDSKLVAEMESMQEELADLKAANEMPYIRENLLEALRDSKYGLTLVEMEALVSDDRACFVPKFIEAYERRGVIAKSKSRYILVRDHNKKSAGDKVCNICGGDMLWDGFGSMSTRHSNFYKCRRCDHETEIYDDER